MEARLRKELLECARDSVVSGVNAEPVDGDLSHWRGTIRGPHDSPYEGGTFGVDIVVPRDYPFAPPAMKFTTRLWHPNVSSQTGAWGGACVAAALCCCVRPATAGSLVAAAPPLDHLRPSTSPRSLAGAICLVRGVRR